MIKTNGKNLRYNYNTPEAQELMKQFTAVLVDLTIYIEKKEQHIILLENRLVTQTRIRYMIKLIVIKLFNYFKESFFFFPRKITNKLRGETIWK